MKHQKKMIGENRKMSKKSGNIFHIMRPFTLIELLVVIAIIAILAGLLFPALNVARDSVKTIECLNNVKQLGVVSMSYVNDYGEYTPGNYSVAGNWTWVMRLAPYYKPNARSKNNQQDNFAAEIPSMYCPRMPTATYNHYGTVKKIFIGHGYAYNRYCMPTIKADGTFEAPSGGMLAYRIKSPEKTKHPTTTLLFAENLFGMDFNTMDGLSPAYGLNPPTVNQPALTAYVFDGKIGTGANYRHSMGRSMNIVYVDGHAVTARPSLYHRTAPSLWPKVPPDTRLNDHDSINYH